MSPLLLPDGIRRSELAVLGRDPDTTPAWSCWECGTVWAIAGPRGGIWAIIQRGVDLETCKHELHAANLAGNAR